MQPRYNARLYERPDDIHKFAVELRDRRTGAKAVISFGALGYEDYTTHHDPARRESYIRRHIAHVMAPEDWCNPFSAGFWSRWLLWEKPSLLEAMADIEKNYSIKFV